jgi:hypothetical protein
MEVARIAIMVSLIVILLSKPHACFAEIQMISTLLDSVKELVREMAAALACQKLNA